ncbi:MAG: prepilin-type N-terminal cleavage/methylation domain-containing protein [Opitutaceae bacterium]|jgi:general secretion pathway protein G|nr:prepilin-type N-terminal cleavage/methylation domain-containing protein [Opitutaceae bacterium]
MKTHASEVIFRRAELRSTRSTRAFTLVELLTVIAIIGILAAITIPVTSSVRGKARQAACASNLRQIGAAFHLYLAENKGIFPPFHNDAGNDMYNWGGRKSRWGGPATETRPLYPYLPPESGIFRCPADKGFGSQGVFYLDSGNSYCAANSGERGVLPRDAGGGKLAIPGVYSQLDQPSRTVLVFDETVRNGEAANRARPWWHPGDTSNILLCDGHVTVFSRQTVETFVNPVNPPGYTWGWSAWRTDSQW